MTLSVPVHVEATFLDQPMAVVVEASIHGDVCEDRLPVVTVQLAGWDEPPVHALVDAEP